MNKFLVTIISLAFTINITSAIKKEIIEYKAGNVHLKGFMVYDDEIKTKLPGVLIVHEWWGLNDYPKMRAEQIAKLGYIAFCVDMYGDGVVAKNYEEAGKLAGSVKSNLTVLHERILAAYNYLKSNDLVDSGKIAVMGYCFGGTVALELARTGAEIKGAVSFHGGLGTKQPVKTNLKAKILVLHGADDKYVPVDEIKSFQEEMNLANADWQMVLYSHSVHAFSNPASGNDNSKGVAYNKYADFRSFQAMSTFFVEIFK